MPTRYPTGDGMQLVREIDPSWSYNLGVATIWMIFKAMNLEEIITESKHRRARERLSTTLQGTPTVTDWRTEERLRISNRTAGYHASQVKTVSRKRDDKSSL
jgi:hypothetical protein